jgi:hypothetical protein
MPMNLNSILLRYNHQAIGNHDRWRFMNNDLETPCASVTFLCASETIEQEVLVKGELVSKWHIRPINPTEIIQKQDEKGIHFIIH